MERRRTRHMVHPEVQPAMIARLFRYFFVGAAAAAIDFSIFFFLVKGLVYPWFSAALFSFVAATAANYSLSIRFVFESRARFNRRSEIALVFLVSGIAMAVNQSILWLTIEFLALNLLISKIAATGTVFLLNFACRHYFIFRPRLPEGTVGSIVRIQ